MLVEVRDMPPVSQALLLAAGEGSRLRPLTDLVPKPLLPIDGVPVIGRLVEQLRALGITSFTVVVSPSGGMLRTFLERHATSDVRLTFVEQPVANGSADAIQHGLAGIDEASPALVAGCDTAWRGEDVRAMLDMHERVAPLVTMAAHRWPIDRLPHRACMEIADDGRIRRVMATAPDGAPSALSGSPLYVVDPAAWPRIRDVRPGASGKAELATALQGAIDDELTVQAVEVRGARDLTRPVDLLRENFPYLAELLPT